MTSLSQLRIVSLSSLLLLAAGCSPTNVNFDGPPGSVLFVNDQPHHLPARVEFLRPAGNGQSNRYNIGLVFKTNVGEVRAKGYADVYGFVESDVDRMVVNNCQFTDQQLTDLANGQTLIYKVSTASKQPLFDLTLTKQ